MKKNFLRTIFSFIALLMIFGCSHKAYMGFHGASIKLHPEVHEKAATDTQCLECHHPDSAHGPATPHPDFKGCLKCHND